MACFLEQSKARSYPPLSRKYIEGLYNGDYFLSVDRFDSWVVVACAPLGARVYPID